MDTDSRGGHLASQRPAHAPAGPNGSDAAVQESLEPARPSGPDETAQRSMEPARPSGASRRRVPARRRPDRLTDGAAGMTGTAAPATLTDAASPAPAGPDSAADAPAIAPAFAPRAGQAVRMCVCGAPNPGSARICHRCGQDISDVMPTAYAGAAAEAADAGLASESAAEAFGGALLRLCSLDGLCALDVSESCVLGRAAVLAEYLADKPYVSRRQAYLTLENGRVYIVHGGGRNPTCLNDRPLREGAPEELHPGDEIALGGMTIDGERQTMAAYFVVQRADDLGEC